MSINLALAEKRLRDSLQQFGPLTDEEWAGLAPVLEIKQYPKHALFAKAGEHAATVGLVLQGELRQYYARDGEEYTTYFFLEGELVSAYISCYTGQPSLVAIEAITDCICLVFPYARLAALFEQSKAWERLGRHVAEYLTRGLEERMASLLTQSAEERYKDLIEGPLRKLMQRIPQHYIANYLGITPVSLSRIRARIASQLD